MYSSQVKEVDRIRAYQGSNLGLLTSELAGIGSLATLLKLKGKM